MFISNKLIVCAKTSLHHVRSAAARASPPHNLHFLHQTTHHPFSKTIQNPPFQESFTVNYLINSCGFSPENAISASKYVKFETSDKPDSVLAFFNNHGFTQTQISGIIRKIPKLLMYDTQKTLLPKLEFLKSKGISSTDFATIVSASPWVLGRSLENCVIPCFNFLSNLLESKEKIIAAMKRHGGLLLFDPQTLTPNVQILREARVPNANIIHYLTKKPRALMLSIDRFRQVVEDFEQMGFNHLRVSFMSAVHALRAMTKSTWEKKVEVYKKWGWTDDEILVAFKKHPYCMRKSEDKINGVMDFFVNKMGQESLLVARRPKLVSVSLEKRIVPRYEVFLVLLSKGLIKTNSISLVKLIEYPEKQFLKKFVNCYEEEAPELLKLYKEKLELAR